MPFPIETTITMILVGLLAYTIVGISGFGAALVSIPILVHFFPLQTLLPILVIVDFIATVTNGIKFKSEIEKEELKVILPTMVAGIGVGTTILVIVSGEILLPILGIFVLAYGYYRLRFGAIKKAIGRHWGYAIGFTGGLLGSVFGVGGPVYATYLSQRIKSFSALRATLSIIFIGSTGMRIVGLSIAGLLFRIEVLWGVLTLTPFMLIGLFTGHRLHGKMSQRTLERFLCALLILSGVSLIAKPFS